MKIDVEPLNDHVGKLNGNLWPILDIRSYDSLPEGQSTESNYGERVTQLGYGILAGRMVVGIVFVASAAGKLHGASAFTGFEAAVRGMGVPARRVRPVAIAVVTAECAVPPLLLAPLGGAAGLMLAAFLLIVFTAGIARALHRNTSTPCNCFGMTSAPVGRTHLVRNAALLGLVAFGLAGTFSGAAPVRSYAGFALTAFGALVGALLVMRAEDLAELFGSGRPAR